MIPLNKICNVPLNTRPVRRRLEPGDGPYTNWGGYKSKKKRKKKKIVHKMCSQKVFKKVLTKSVHKKCPQKVSTKSVKKILNKKCPQKVSTKSYHKKCSPKVSKIEIHKKCLKNPAYGRHQLSRPMRIIGPIQI